MDGPWWSRRMAKHTAPVKPMAAFGLLLYILPTVQGELVQLIVEAFVVGGRMAAGRAGDLVFVARVERREAVLFRSGSAGRCLAHRTYPGRIEPPGVRGKA